MKYRTAIPNVCATQSFAPAEPNDLTASEKMDELLRRVSNRFVSHLLYFDNWKHALEIVKTTNLKNVSEHEPTNLA